MNKWTVIQDCVAKEFKVTRSDIVGVSREIRITRPRQIAMLLSRKAIKHASFPQIGKRFNRDHATAMYNIRVAERHMNNNGELAEKVERIIDELRKRGIDIACSKMEAAE